MASLHLIKEGSKNLFTESVRKGGGSPTMTMTKTHTKTNTKTKTKTFKKKVFPYI